tara:strand:+ start:863 stop:967 length:105 start_codon:yes stop_codon:yes gene_type:complete
MKMILELVVYVFLAAIGASIATWILHNIWDVFYV